MWLKREDRNPTGSHKDRAAHTQVAGAVARGESAVVISSSGNAAVATSRAAELAGIPAIACVHPDTEPAKYAAICGATTTRITTPRAINAAKRIARAGKYPNLRPSTSDDALPGFATIADELLADSARCRCVLDAVVLFATSGATALAVAQRFGELGSDIEVHVVQGEGNAAIADPSSDTSHARTAAAGRLGVRSSRRAEAVRSAVAASGGALHVASEADVAAGRALLATRGIVVSDESAANIAIAQRIAAGGERTIACIISGAAPSPWRDQPAVSISCADEWEALALLGLDAVPVQ